MTKKEAEQIFKDNYWHSIPKNDKPAVRQAWNDFTDSLCKDGQITRHQYESWLFPRFIK